MNFLRNLFRRFLDWLADIQPPGDQPAPNPVPTPSAPPKSPSGTALELLNLCNQARHAEGLLSFGLEERLTQAAQRHANWMGQNEVLDHRGNSDLSRRLLEVNYSWKAIAENIAIGELPVSRVFARWMDSPGHRRNILGPYRDVGFGVFPSEDGDLYWCAVFASPKNEGLSIVSGPKPVHLSGPLRA